MLRGASPSWSALFPALLLFALAGTAVGEVSVPDHILVDRQSPSQPVQDLARWFGALAMGSMVLVVLMGAAATTQSRSHGPRHRNDPRSQPGSWFGPRLPRN
jgi:hypothetical protein